MRRPPLTIKKIRVILDSLHLLGGCAGIDDPDFVQEGSCTEQDRNDYHEATDFMRRLLWWHEWKQDQKQEQKAQKIIDEVMSSMGIRQQQRKEMK